MGPGYAFRGLVPTLWRDVPFSAVYWSCYEHLRMAIMPLMPASAPFAASFLAGTLAGSLAAAATTPFDVAKTRRQLTTPILPSISGRPTSLAKNNYINCISNSTSRNGICNISHYSGSNSNSIHFNELKSNFSNRCHGYSINNSAYINAVETGDSALHSKSSTSCGNSINPSGNQQPQRTLARMREIVRTEGARALWRGLLPRVAKVAPACGIMVGTYVRTNEYI